MSWTKLELTWPGKNKAFELEPRILIEKPELSYGDPNTENMLIHWDNLLALKALEQQYNGKIKCIYIDPPYNTWSAFEYYDDWLEHTEWLNLMYRRLIILKNLLSDDGVIFVQLDDNEQSYLKIIMDEIFWRNNYLNTISIKTKSSSWASGGWEDKKLKKNVEFLTVYRKSENFDRFEDQYQDIPIKKYLEELSEEWKNFAYTSVLVNEWNREFFWETSDWRWEPIKIFKHTNYQIKSISQISKEEWISIPEVIEKYFSKVYTLENAQTSIRDRVLKATDENDTFYTIEYFPVSWKNKNQLTTVWFMWKTKRLVSYLRNTCIEEKWKIYKRIKIWTLWSDLSWSSVSLEGWTSFPNWKKPELLIKRVLDMCTHENEYVLDSFLWSWTTAAVAHKMKRKYIWIELWDHAYTHCKVRLDKVIDWEQWWISKIINRQWWGWYKFYELWPSVLLQDKYWNYIINPNFNSSELVQAICKIENFTYKAFEDNIKHGYSTEKDFIHVTTRHITQEIVKDIQETSLKSWETMLIVAKTFESNLDLPDNIQIKKIPTEILDKCEYNKDNYSLPISEEAIKDED